MTMPSGRASPDTVRHCEPKGRNVGGREAIPFGKDKSGTSLPLATAKPKDPGQLGLESTE